MKPEKKMKHLPDIASLMELVHLPNFFGGFLIIPQDCISELGLKALASAAAGAVRLGSLEYWKLVVHSESHGIMHPAGRFGFYDQEGLTVLGKLGEGGEIRLFIGDEKVGRIVQNLGKVLFVQIEDGPIYLWAFVPGVNYNYQESPADPAVMLTAELEFEMLISRIKELGL